MIEPQQITTTNSSCTNPTISAYKNELLTLFHLAYEQDVDQYTSRVKYSSLQFSGDITQCSQLANPPIQISNSSYMRNTNPSIVAVPNYGWYICWISAANPSVAPKCAYTNYNTGATWYFANYVTSVAINMANNSSNGYVAWNQNMSHVNQLVNAANVNNIANLNTAGPDIQMSNGPTKNDMRVSSYYKTSLPYYWNTSQSLGSLLPKVTPGSVSSGRGCTLNYGNANFLFTFGDLNVDGQNIGFVDVPDTAKLEGIEKVNSVLLSQPFNLTKDSKVTFTECDGFADSSASTSVLGSQEFIGYIVELINNVSNEVIGTLENVSLTASNLHSAKMISYLLNTKNIKSGTYRIRVTMKTNLDNAKVHLVENRALENPASNASTLSLVNLKNIDIITDYGLAQNYPNPFNPTTTITYQLPKDGMVTLKIYDMLGREAATLVNNEQKTAGRYNVRFNANNLASGVYIYQLKVNDLAGGNGYTATKKLMLLK